MHRWGHGRELQAFRDSLVPRLDQEKVRKPYCIQALKKDCMRLVFCTLFRVLSTRCSSSVFFTRAVAQSIYLNLPTISRGVETWGGIDFTPWLCKLHAKWFDFFTALLHFRYPRRSANRSFIVNKPRLNIFGGFYHETPKKGFQGILPPL